MKCSLCDKDIINNCGYLNCGQCSTVIPVADACFPIPTEQDYACCLRCTTDTALQDYTKYVIKSKQGYPPYGKSMPFCIDCYLLKAPLEQIKEE